MKYFRERFALLWLICSSEKGRETVISQCFYSSCGLLFAWQCDKQSYKHGWLILSKRCLKFVPRTLLEYSNSFIFCCFLVQAKNNCLIRLLGNQEENHLLLLLEFFLSTSATRTSCVTTTCGFVPDVKLLYPHYLIWDLLYTSRYDIRCTNHWHKLACVLRS